MTDVIIRRTDGKMFAPTVVRQSVTRSFPAAKIRDLIDGASQCHMRRRYHGSWSVSPGASTGASGKYFRTWVTPSDGAVKLEIALVLYHQSSAEDVGVWGGSSAYLPVGEDDRQYTTVLLQHDTDELGLSPGDEIEIYITLDNDQAACLSAITIYDRPDASMDDSHSHWVDPSEAISGGLLRAATMQDLNASIQNCIDERGEDPLATVISVQSDDPAIVWDNSVLLESGWRNAFDSSAAGFSKDSSVGLQFKPGAAWDGDDLLPVRMRVFAWSDTGDYELRVSGAVETTPAQTIAAGSSYTEYVFDTFTNAKSSYRPTFHEQLDLEMRDTSMGDVIQISNIILEQRRRRQMGSQKPLFRALEFSGGQALPSVNRIPTTVTLNSDEKQPDFIYRGVDADATELAALDGTDLPVTAGTAPAVSQGAPGHESADASFQCSDAIYEAASSDTGQITTEDVVWRAIFRMPETSAGQVLAQKHNGSDGWSIEANGSDQLVASLDGATGNVTVTSAALSPRCWYCASLIVDASGSAQWHINWETSGSAVVVSGVGSISNNGVLRIGGSAAGTNNWDAPILYFSQHSGASWLDTHSQIDWHRELVMRWRGVWPGYAAGTKLLQQSPRTTAGYEQKIESGVYKWYLMGPGLPRVWEVSEGVYKLWCEQEADQVARGTHNFGTGWTKVAGSVSASTTEEGPFDGMAPMEWVSDGTTGAHGAYANCSATPGGSGETITYRQRFKAGSEDWIAFRIFHNGAYAGKYFDIANGTIGNNFGGAPASSKITSLGDGWYEVEVEMTSTAATNVNMQWYPAAGNGIFTTTGDGSTVQLYTVAPDARIDQDFRDSHIIAPATASVSRTADQVRYKADDGNVSATSAQLMAKAKVWLDGAISDVRDALVLSDGGSGADYVSIGLAGSGTAAAAASAATGGSAGSTSTSTSVVDADTHDLQANLQEDSLRALVDGSFEGTEDTDVAVPDDIDRIDVGHSDGATVLNGGISDVKIYESNLRKAV